MKKCFLLPVVLFTVLFANAGEYFKGKVIAANKKEREVLYDRTQLTISPTVHQSVYKVLDAGRKLQYTITLTNDSKEGAVFIALKSEGAGSNGFAVRYDADASGLIFSDVSNYDTAYSVNRAHRYIFSFTDANRDFPILHKLKTDKGIDVLLDPISPIRIKMHLDVVKKLPRKSMYRMRPEATYNAFYGLAPQDDLKAEMTKMRLQLYAYSKSLSDSVKNIEGVLDREVAGAMKGKKMSDTFRKYTGASVKGEPEGQGFLIDKGNVYSGTFKTGTLTKGTASLKKPTYSYVGQYSNNNCEGTGKLSYPDGSYLLGTFKKSALETGLSYSRTETETYFGGFKNNQRNGYGELHSNNDLFFGEFVNGKLVKGYTKEVDQFGYSTYSQIENGEKLPADTETAEEFFAEAIAAN